MKYKNNNNEDINQKENSLKKFNVSGFRHDNNRKNSYSVTKSKMNLSFYSTKAYKEDLL